MGIDRTSEEDFGMSEKKFEMDLSLIHISEPTRLLSTSYAVFCLTKTNIHFLTPSH